jgi:hypothetical protein
VLPSDLAGARRLTHLRLAQLARESNLKFLRATFEPVAERTDADRAEIEMVLSGSYADMRAFIHSSKRHPSSWSSTTWSLGRAPRAAAERHAASVDVLPDYGRRERAP